MNEVDRYYRYNKIELRWHFCSLKQFSGPEFQYSSLHTQFWLFSTILTLIENDVCYVWLQKNTFVVKSIKASPVSSSIYLKSFILQGNSCLENCFSYKCENKNHPKAIYVQTFPTHPTTVYTKYENGTCSEFSKSNFIFILLLYIHIHMIIQRLYKIYPSIEHTNIPHWYYSLSSLNLSRYKSLVQYLSKRSVDSRKIFVNLWKNIVYNIAEFLSADEQFQLCPFRDNIRLFVLRFILRIWLFYAFITFIYFITQHM